MWGQPYGTPSLLALPPALDSRPWKAPDWTVQLHLPRDWAFGEKGP